MFLCEKGRQLTKKTEVRAKENVLHEVIRHAYQDVHDYRNAELVLGLAESLQLLTHQGILPETGLLLALMPSVARKIEATTSFRAMVAFRKMLAKVTIGKLLDHRGLLIFSLSWPETPESPYALLEQAIEAGDVEINLRYGWLGFVKCHLAMSVRGSRREFP